MTVREPILQLVPIADLRPTQMTVGFREVAEKRREWREKSEKSAGKYLGRHMVPAVQGPNDRFYLVDHHHLAMALWQAEQNEVLVTAISDLRTLKKDAFWTYMDNRAWCHPYDTAGRRRDFGALPKRIADLEDDPYRSLAGELRRSGGFAKDTTPFSEFLWADFLRRRVSRKQIEDQFNVAVEKALKLAKSNEAAYLPGWCGPQADT